MTGKYTFLLLTWNLIEFPNEWMGANCVDPGNLPAVLLEPTVNKETGELGGHQTNCFQ